MENIVIVVNIILAVLLVLVVLMQKSEGGALGIGNSQDSFISSRSASNFLTKTTAILATLFIVTSIIITIFSKQEISSISVIDKKEEIEDTSSPKIPTTNE